MRLTLTEVGCNILFTPEQMRIIASALETACEIYQSDRQTALTAGQERIAAQFERQANDATALLLAIRHHGF